MLKIGAMKNLKYRNQARLAKKAMTPRLRPALAVPLPPSLPPEDESRHSVTDGRIPGR